MLPSEMFQIMFVGFSFLPLSPLMRINRDEREGDIDFDFPRRRDQRCQQDQDEYVDGTGLCQWSDTNQSWTVERMRGLLRCMAMACFVETNCDTRDEIWPIGTVLNS